MFPGSERPRLPDRRFRAGRQPLGRLNRRKAREGHRFYSTAKFFAHEQVVALAGEAGFVLERDRSCLFRAPGQFASDPSSQEEFTADAGFVAMEFSKILDHTGAQPEQDGEAQT